MKFEEAQKIKEKIEVLENYQSRSTILNPKISNIDVFSIVSDEGDGVCQLSADCPRRHYPLVILWNSKRNLMKPMKNLLELAVVELEGAFSSETKEIILPFAFRFWR